VLLGVVQGGAESHSTGVPTMAEQTTLPAAELIDNAAIDRAHAAANKEALLEHARMGRSVCEGRDGKVVWITPAEIFARYGLDANGKAKPEENSPLPLDPVVIARLHIRDQLDRMLQEGQLSEYTGGYVVFGNGQICGHGATLVEARKNALATHPEVDAQYLVDYFVPTE